MDEDFLLSFNEAPALRRGRAATNSNLITPTHRFNEAPALRRGRASGPDQSVVHIVLLQ